VFIKYTIMYSRKDYLKITHRIGVPEDVNQILEEQKQEQKLSKAKIVTNLILETYGNQDM